MTLGGGLKTVLHIPHADRCVTDVGYRVASLLHCMLCFTLLCLCCLIVVQCDARHLENEVDHDIDHLCTRGPPDFGHEHRLVQQCVTLIFASVVPPPTTEQKAEEKGRINEMKEKPRSGRHLIPKIPNGNRRSRAKKLREVASLQGSWMRGKRIAR